MRLGRWQRLRRAVVEAALTAAIFVVAVVFWVLIMARAALYKLFRYDPDRPRDRKPWHRR
jgi:hypothetical protein